jgi:AraC-like DNA-binding protein
MAGSRPRACGRWIGRSPCASPIPLSAPRQSGAGFISERYVQQLLEGAGSSFSAYLRDLRLKRARELLADPLTGRSRIGDIALMTGFNDLSHFNRMFRLKFGETPTDARRRR